MIKAVILIGGPMKGKTLACCLACSMHFVMCVHVTCELILIFPLS